MEGLILSLYTLKTAIFMKNLQLLHELEGHTTAVCLTHQDAIYHFTL